MNPNLKILEALDQIELALKPFASQIGVVRGQKEVSWNDYAKAAEAVYLVSQIRTHICNAPFLTSAKDTP